MNYKLLFLSIMFLLSISITYATGTYPEVDPNMVLYYHFNNDSSVGENRTYVYDYSNAHSNNGTVVGSPVYNQSDGFLGDGAYRFNGSNYVKILNNLSLSPYNNSKIYTFSIWFKLADDDKGTGSLATQYIFAKGATNQFEYQLERSNSTDGRKIYFRIFNLTGSASNLLTLYTGWTPETWYMATITYNGTDAISYFNGDQIGSVTLTRPDGSGTANLDIGARADTATGTSSGALNGSVDEFIAYNRTLSRQEVWELYDTYLGCQDVISETIYGDTHYCSGTYNINSTHNNAVIVIGNPNIDVYCAGTIIKGNYTQTNTSSFRNRGIQNIGGYQNISINNCAINDYYLATYLLNADNQTLNNITSLNSSALTDFSNVTNSLIANSTCNNCNVFTSETLLNNTILDNLYCNNSVDNVVIPGQSCLSLTNGKNIILKNSRFSRSGGVYVTGANQYNITLLNNSFLTQAISTSADGRHLILRDTTGNSSDFYITKNYFDNFDLGIVMTNISNVYIRNNTFINATTNQDYYDTAIHVQFNITNLLIEGNNITNFGSTGILLRQTNGAIIRNNYFYNNYTQLLNNNYDCYPTANYCNSEPNTAIFVHEIYKGFIPIGTGAGYNYTNAHPQISNNITISNNSFININTLLRTQGTTNLTHDLQDFWFRSFQIPYYIDIDNFWISNSFDNASRIENGSLSSLLYQGIYQNFTINYTLSKNNGFFKSVNAFSPQINLYNQSNVLVFYGNRSVVCSSISSCDGNINFTLAPSVNATVLPEFNLTEGVSRANSPLWVVSRSDDGRRMIYHLGSNLTSIIHNVTFVPSAQIVCGSVSYLSNTSSYVDTVITSCVNGFITSFLISGFEPSSSSNILSITYSSGASGGGSSSGSNNSFPYNKTVLCSNAKIFLEENKKLGIISYTSEEFMNFHQKMEILLGRSISQDVLEPFINNYQENCEENNTINNTGVITTNDETRKNYLSFIFVGITFVIIIIIILIIDIAFVRPRKKEIRIGDL